MLAVGQRQHSAIARLSACNMTSGWNGVIPPLEKSRRWPGVGPKQTLRD